MPIRRLNFRGLDVGDLPIVRDSHCAIFALDADGFGIQSTNKWEEKMLNYENAARDNTYNSENDLSANFTWSVWTDDDDTSGDWCYPRQPAYVAICRHRGGDVRGNYGAPSLHRFDGVDSGFLDWVLGWHIQRFEGFTNVELDDITPTVAEWIVSESVTDDDLTERCSPGYASLPSSELWNDTKTDSVFWFNGSAIIRLDDGSGWLVATPYHYSDCDIELPENGSGWLCDASIDTDSFIDTVLGECILDSLGERSEKLCKWIEQLDWDHDEVIAKLCKAARVLTEVC